MYDQHDKPTKQQVREWLSTRNARPAPLPDLAALRQQIGWRAVSAADRADDIALHRAVAIVTAD